MVKRPMLQQSLQLGRFSFWRLLLASIWALLSFACGGAAVQDRTVSDVRVLETSPSAVELDDALNGLTLAAPRRLFWIERERDAYDANLLARDLERIERFYRAHGYYDVKVVAARVESVGPREVEIEVHVTPGPRVTVRSVKSNVGSAFDLSTPESLTFQAVPKPVVGSAFTEEVLDHYESDLLSTLKEAGFAYAKVRVTASVDLNAHAADIVATLSPGRRARFGDVRVVGLRQIPENKVRAALLLKRGAPYKESEQIDAREALESLQLFTRVEVTPDLSHPEAEEVPILVSVQEDQLRQITLGGGTNLDALTLQMHVSSGWEHKNFLGGARKLTVTGKLGIDLFPNRLESLDTLWRAPSNWFLVADSSVSLEQPAIFNGRTKGRVTARFKREPLLYPLEKDDVPEKQVVLGYNTPSGSVELSRRYWGKRIEITPSYNLEARIPFYYQKPVETTDEGGPQTVWVSYPALYGSIQALPGDLQALFDKGSNRQDKRDFTISFRNTVQLAGLSLGGTRVFGGSVSDVKVQPELRVFFPAWGTKLNRDQKVGNVILASRFKVGFLLGADYSSDDQQKVLTRGFYSGGSLSNRGYTQNAISPQGPIGVLQATGVNCSAGSKYAETANCIRPLGGFSQWEASFEIRFAGLYPLGLVAFMDASDVSRDVFRIQFKYPHLSVGPGLRYDSPVGPIRLDFGFRVPGWQAIGERELPLSHGKETPNLFESCDDNGVCRGIPAAINLAIGDAF